MTMDLISVGFILFLMILGYFSGAMLQVFKIIALIASYLIGKSLGPTLGYQLLKGSINLPETLLKPVAIVLTMLVFYLIISIVGYSIIYAIRNRSRVLSSFDRRGGILIGGLKGVVLIYILACGLVFLAPNVKSFSPGLQKQIHTSKIVRLTSHYNILTSLPQFKFLHNAVLFARAKKDPAEWKKLSREKKFQDLAKDPTIQSLCKNDRIRKALIEKDYLKLLQDPQVLKVFKDENLMKRLNAL